MTCFTSSCLGKSQVCSAAILVNPVVGDIDSAGIDAENVVIAVVSVGAA